MNTKSFKFIILFVVFSIQFDRSNGVLRCHYSDLNSKIQIAGNTLGYTCRLSNDGPNSDLGIIEGSHESPKNDESVKYVKKYFDFRINPLGKLKNSLTKLSSAFCEKFANLEGIFLDNTDIKTIEANAFDRCNNLENLNLASNKIKEIAPNLLKHNHKLKTLWLSQNNLKTIPENILSDQSKLEILDMSKNQISSFPGKSFANLLSLKELDLSNNNINQLPDNPFKPSNNIKSLSLSNNKIRMLKKKFFDKLDKLEFLDLSSNIISDLPNFGFSGLKNLKYLMISFNKITTIHYKSFGRRSKLVSVDFEGNYINYIDERFVDNINFSEISMTNNVCSEDSIIYRNELKEKLAYCFENYENLHLTGEISDVENCGKRTILRSTIRNGQDVLRGEYPWVVSLEKTDKGFICGSSLISKKSIITAAHCINDKKSDVVFQASELKALVGAYNLKDTRESGTYPVDIRSTFIHPKWNQNSKRYDADIAILELDLEVTYTTYIRPICLMDPMSDLAQISTGIVVGYGMDENGIYGTKPKLMTSPIIDHDECIKINSDLEDVIGYKSFCGGYGNGTGACVGDSGSGLVVAHEAENAFYLRGIVSSSLTDSLGVCNVQTHSVFTDVLKFHLWIQYTKLKIHSSTEEERDHYDQLINIL